MKDEESKDESAGDVDAGNSTEVCTNYRYARRNDPAHMPKDEEDQKDKRDQQESPMVKRNTKVQPSKQRKGDKSKKDPAQIEAEEKAAREAEEEKKLKEAEIARKQAEE